MSRFFLEVSYKGTLYGGFQKQENANTIQAEVEKALQIYFRKPFELTGSSRTDAGVHALQNYFHFDNHDIDSNDLQKSTYHLNAILPDDIVIRKLIPVREDAHSRFDAVSRTYAYTVYNFKDPFLADRAYFFPYTLDFDKLQSAAKLFLGTEQFEAFCKKNTQVQHFRCKLFESEWRLEAHKLVYHVKGNRFLRGMVRGLTGTMLRVGTGKLDLSELENIIQKGDNRLVDFSVPACGLQLIRVSYNFF